MSPYLKAHIQWNKWQDKLWCPLEDAYYLLIYLIYIYYIHTGERPKTGIPISKPSLQVWTRNYKVCLPRSISNYKHKSLWPRARNNQRLIALDRVKFLSSRFKSIFLFWPSSQGIQGILASSEGCTCLDVELSFSSIFCSKTRIYFPVREGHNKTTEWWQAGTRFRVSQHLRSSYTARHITSKKSHVNFLSTYA